MKVNNEMNKKGEFNRLTKEIQINRDIHNSVDELAKTILHETLHLEFDKMKICSEESAISFISENIERLLAESKEMAKMIW